MVSLGGVSLNPMSWSWPTLAIPKAGVRQKGPCCAQTFPDALEGSLGEMVS